MFFSSEFMISSKRRINNQFENSKSYILELYRDG